MERKQLMENNGKNKKKCKENRKGREENLDVKTRDSKDLAISRLKNRKGNTVEFFFLCASQTLCNE